jgi:hypothetical protein
MGTPLSDGGGGRGELSRPRDGILNRLCQGSGETLGNAGPSDSCGLRGEYLIYE